MKARAILFGVLCTIPAFAEDEPVVGVIAHVAEEEGKTVVTDEWIAAQVHASEELYAPLGLHFRVVERRTLPKEKARVTTRADRDTYAKLCQSGVINVFAIASLRDVDTSEEIYRMGVTWIGGNARYIFVAQSARGSTLAHEIGHFFGLHHSSVKNNLMSYDRDGGPVFLDATQSRTVIDFARAMLGARALTLEARVRKGAGALASL